MRIFDFDAVLIDCDCIFFNRDEMAPCRIAKLRSENGVRANCAAKVAELIISRIRIVNPDFILLHGYIP